MKTIFNVHLEQLARQLLPMALRPSRLLVAMVNSGVNVLGQLYGQFIEARQAAIDILGITAQVCMLQKALNNRFDSQHRRIQITSIDRMEATYLFTQTEGTYTGLGVEAQQDPSHLYSLSLFTGQELARPLGFTVSVPTAVGFCDQEMRALLNRYKLPGTQYTIETTITHNEQNA